MFRLIACAMWMLYFRSTHLEPRKKNENSAFNYLAKLRCLAFDMFNL